MTAGADPRKPLRLPTTGIKDNGSTTVLRNDLDLITDSGRLFFITCLNFMTHKYAVSAWEELSGDPAEAGALCS